MSGISIGKVIFQILSGDRTVAGYVVKKIYPIFAPDETVNPFIVFERGTLNPTYTKDGLSYDDVSLIINIVSDNYTECINITEAVRSALERITGGVYNGITIYQILVSNVSEDFGVDGYITSIEFTIKCK